MTASISCAAGDIHAAALWLRRLAGGRFARRGQVQIGVNDLAAVGGEAVGDRLADAARRAGDQTYLARQIAFHGTVPRKA